GRNEDVEDHHRDQQRRRGADHEDGRPRGRGRRAEDRPRPDRRGQKEKERIGKKPRSSSTSAFSAGGTATLPPRMRFVSGFAPADGTPSTARRAASCRRSKPRRPPSRKRRRAT